jgi:hypothetical protein
VSLLRHDAELLERDLTQIRDEIRTHRRLEQAPSKQQMADWQYAVDFLLTYSVRHVRATAERMEAAR